MASEKIKKKKSLDANDQSEGFFFSATIGQSTMWFFGVFFFFQKMKWRKMMCNTTKKKKSLHKNSRNMTQEFLIILTLNQKVTYGLVMLKAAVPMKSSKLSRNEPVQNLDE